MSEFGAITKGPWTYDDYDIVGPHGFVARNVSAEYANLLIAAPDLYEALKIARECIAYCRRSHPDPQSGTGMPVEIIIDAALQLACEGR